MDKFREEVKLEAVQRYLSRNESLRTIGKDIGVPHRTLLTWVKQHEYNGSEAFVKQYTKYTEQLKIDLLNYLTEHGTSIHEKRTNNQNKHRRRLCRSTSRTYKTVRNGKRVF